MKLIEDLGLRNVGSQGYRKSFGLYECPVCHKHFECTISAVKSGNIIKCKGCANKQSSGAKAILAASEFTKKAMAIHDDLYGYLLVNYVNHRTKVDITCKVHGIFEQTPNSHLQGRGCPACAFERNNIALRMSEKNDKPTTLYYIYFPEVNLWKVGCTSQTIEERFSRETLEYIIIKTKEYASGNEAYRVEKFILDAAKDFQFNGKVLGAGNTELRTQPIEYFDELVLLAESTFQELDS